MSEAAYVNVRQVSRNEWLVTICYPYRVNGDLAGYRWWRRTEASARHKGIKELAKYNRKFGNLSEGFTIQ